MRYAMNQTAKRVSYNGILAGAALVMAFFEHQLPPLPMLPPGAKLGLSNIAVMLAAGTAGLGSAVSVTVIKGVYAFMSRGATAGMMSLCGGLCSCLLMWLLLNRTKASLLLTGVAGALSHNLAQLVLAYFITSTPVGIYLPYMVIFGVITGLLSSFILKLAMPALLKIYRWLR